jgi:vitamin B12 transporter
LDIKKHIVLAAGLLLSLSFSAHAQSLDSTAAITLDEIKVFGKKPAQYAVGSRITNIGSTTLNRFNASSLADILQLRTPLHIKSYGQGMLSTVSFRGTGAAHTAVIWNGFNITFQRWARQILPVFL